MRCSWCEPRLDRFLEGTLRPHDMRVLAAHVRNCHSCASLLTELRVVDALLATTAPAELAPNFTFAVMAEVHSQRVVTPKPRSLWAILAFYVVGAWIAIGALAAMPGTRFNGTPALGGLRMSLGHASAAIAGAAHAIGPMTPLVVTTVATILTLDLMVLAVLIFFHRTVRPHLRARLASPEAT